MQRWAGKRKELTRRARIRLAIQKIFGDKMKKEEKCGVKNQRDFNRFVWDWSMSRAEEAAEICDSLRESRNRLPGSHLNCIHH